MRSVTCPDQRDIVTTPPRTGKSSLLAVWTAVWGLMTDPDLQIALISYSDELATTHSRLARQIINEHEHFLGFRLSPDKTSAARWAVENRRGGLLAAGIMSGITGHGCDLLILDDVLKNAQEADSPAHRRRILHEYRATLAPRVHPGGSTCLVMTRWSPEDLAGELLAAEPDVWRYTNVPAVQRDRHPRRAGPRDQRRRDDERAGLHRRALRGRAADFGRTGLVRSLRGQPDHAERCVDQDGVDRFLAHSHRPAQTAENRCGGGPFGFSGTVTTAASWLRRSPPMESWRCWRTPRNRSLLTSGQVPQSNWRSRWVPAR